MEKKPDYTRLRDTLIDANGAREKFPSIGAAKRRSRFLQQQGKIVVVDRSEDPVAKPLNFGRKHRSVSFAEERRIQRYNEREERMRQRQADDPLNSRKVAILSRRMKVAP
jgi:hypothetical protein